MFHRRSVAVVTLFAASSLSAQNAPKVGPPSGTVIVVGGGSMGPEIYSRFIAAAGGPDALIIDVPTAGGDSAMRQSVGSTRGWRQAGAKNIYVLHTKDKQLANSDSLADIIKKAGGVWFEGGRQFYLVDSYAGTKTEQAFHDVLARGGVVGGSSAGATILGDFLVRGARATNEIMADPQYNKGFAFLRGVGIDQHVVARERLADLADSIMPKYPDLLGMSEDEGTAWVVKGDTATIVGRNKAFVYGGKDATDAHKPFLTLYPGDTYNLATRHVIKRVSAGSPVTGAYVDGLFSKYSNQSLGGATVLVAQNGSVLIDRSYGIPDQAKYMPTTTVPQFALGGITEVFNALCTQIPEPPARGNSGATPDSAAAGRGRGRGRNPGPPATPFQNCITRRISTPIGMHKTNATPDGMVQSDVDELYRLSLGLEVPRTFVRDTTSAPATTPSTSIFDPNKAWQTDTYKGVTRFTAYGAPGGKRAAFVRVPDKRATIIVLTNDDTADAKGIADKLTDKLLFSKN